MATARFGIRTKIPKPVATDSQGPSAPADRRRRGVRGGDRQQEQAEEEGQEGDGEPARGGRSPPLSQSPVVALRRPANLSALDTDLRLVVIVVRSPVISPFTSTVPSITNTSPSTIPSITTSPWMTKTPSSTVSPSALPIPGDDDDRVVLVRCLLRDTQQREPRRRTSRRRREAGSSLGGVFHRPCGSRAAGVVGRYTSMPSSAKNGVCRPFLGG